MQELEAINVGIVGGGRGCKAVMDMVLTEKLKRLRMKILGVADLNQNAVGIKYAQKQGIYTTTDYRDLYKLKDLNMIIELTGREDVANEIPRTKPDHLRFMDHVAARVFWDIFQLEEERIRDRKRAEEAARESEKKYRLVVDNASDAIFIVQDGVIKLPNPKVEEIVGYSESHLTNTPFAEFVAPEDRDMVVERHKKRLKGEEVPTTYSFRIRDSSGELLWAEVNAVLITWEKRPAVLCFLRDITTQKKLEAQLQYARKIEAVGTLAGGVAHDFNNLLMGIQGNVSLMLMDRDSTDPDYERLKNIERQIQSGARLTSHLLGYARKGTFEIQPLDLNQLAEETSDTFGRTKKEIAVHRELAKDLSAIEADPAQIEQVLLNLFVNAADAMPSGGQLTLKTMNVTHKDMKGKLYEPKLGKYVLLTVTDTGTGMYKKTMERIFDPFFTTKEMGRGTGLGLASAYGIIKGHGGYIDVDSKRGQGTTFSIYLPASDKEVRKEIKAAGRFFKGSGTVLLVDDEEAVLQVGQELLEAIGYKVLTARDGKEAIRTYKKNQDNIDIVVLDVVMPKMGGGVAYDVMKDINPDVKVLLSSGFSIDGEASRILKRGCKGFIQKPFTVKELSREIRRAMAKQ